MASGIFAVLDDIAALMDDVAIASKIATKKTAGILGDDLAVNAEKATGFLASRELPVLWAITKGSLLNKVIIIPIALVLNMFFPIAIKGVLLLGGCYLAYEGVEKIIEYLFHKKNDSHNTTNEIPVDDANIEKSKIKSAVTTDFILSVEIVILALHSVINNPWQVQVITVAVVALIATVGVYGIVALIVRMDDAGFKLIHSSHDKGWIAKLGHLLVKGLPMVIKSLSVIGTIALLLVSGGIFVHNIDFLHHILPTIPSFIKEFAIGIIVGLIVLVIVVLVTKVIALVQKKR